MIRPSYKIGFKSVLSGICVSFLTLAVAFSAFAGGSIFGGKSKKSSNTEGINSVGIYICGSLNCPDVVIKQGDCDGVEHAIMQYGVCTCEEGYHVVGETCVVKEDKCADVVLNECQESCDELTGKITNKSDGLCTLSGKSEAGFCYNGECLNPCEEYPIEFCTACIAESGKSVCSACETGYELNEGRCISNTCSSTNKDTTGCSAYTSCTTPTQTYYTCTKCETGYRLEGNACVANTCTSTNTDTTGCSAYTSCTTPKETYYTCTKCQDGYHLEGDACVVNTCTSTNTDTTGCSAYTSCTTPTETYYTCTKCQDGYHLEGDACVANTCTSANTDKTGCSAYDTCTTPTQTYYTCTECETGYHLEGDACVANTCTSTNTDVTGCSTYDTCLTPTETYYTCTKCQDGYHLEGYVCVVNTCTSTNTDTTGCSAYTSCTTPTETYYTCTKCQDGYHLEGDICVENTCTSTNTDTTACSAYDTCTTPTQTYYTCTGCETGYILSVDTCVEDPCGFKDTSGNCHACSEASAVEANSTECDRCASETVPRFIGGSGYCVLCSESSGFPAVSEKECAKCGSLRDSYRGYCFLSNCTSGYFRDPYGECKPCSTTDTISSTENQCSRCPYRGMDGEYCKLCSGHGTWNGTSCICNSGYTGTNCGTTVETCDGWTITAEITGCTSGSQTTCTVGETTYYKCSACNTGYNLEGDTCVEDPCGFKDTSGNCHTCSDTSSWEATEEECSLCPYRGMDGEYCKLCSGHGTWNGSKCMCNSGFTGTNCHNCSEGYLHNSSGSCISCSVTSSWLSTEEECNACGDLRKMFGSYCGLVDCGEGKFHNSDGYCTSCSAFFAYSATEEECSLCPYRGMDGSYCKRCSGHGTLDGSSCTCNTGYTGTNCHNCSEGYFQDSSGYCYSCSDTTPYSATEEECSLCPYRGMDGEYCKLCSGHGTWNGSKCTCDDGYEIKGETCALIERNMDGWLIDENKSCDITSKPGTCSVCLTVENTVEDKGVNEFWAPSNALCSSGEFCVDGSCITLEGEGCTKNSDCSGQKSEDDEDCGSDGCYCNYGNSYTNNFTPTNKGTCVLKTKAATFEFMDGSASRVAVLTSNDVWSNKNFCEAWNMRLATWNELDCSLEGSKVSLSYLPGTPIHDAYSAITGTSEHPTMMANALGSDDYPLFRAAENLIELATSPTVFFICR